MLVEERSVGAELLGKELRNGDVEREELWLFERGKEAVFVELVLLVLYTVSDDYGM
jgi:hypothetical protein